MLHFYTDILAMNIDNMGYYSNE